MQRAAQVLVAKRSLVTIALTAAVSTSGGVQAVEIQIGNPDINLRLDNTVRYTFGCTCRGAGRQDHCEQSLRCGRSEV